MSAQDAAASRAGRARAPVAAPAWQAQFVLLAAIWGSSFLCIKVLGEHWPPVDVALGRIALGAVTLLVVLAARGDRLPRDRATWGHLAVVGLLMNAAPFSLFALGERTVPSVLAGLWNATTPLMTMLAVLVLLPAERPDRRGRAALVVGFAGVALVLGPWRGLGGDALLGQLACAGAAACYGIGLPYTRRHLSGRPESGPALAAAQLVCATAILAPIAPLAGMPPTDLPVDALASLAALGVLGSGVAYVLTHAIIRAAGATTFSTVTYVIPIFSTVLGVAVLSEPLSWNEPVGAAIVLGAMAWSGRRPDRLRRRASS